MVSLAARYRESPVQYSLSIRAILLDLLRCVLSQVRHFHRRTQNMGSHPSMQFEEYGLLYRPSMREKGP